MIDGLIQKFAGGEAQSLEGEGLHGDVGQMLQSAPRQHGVGAIGDALGSLGAGGFGQSVQQGALNASPQQRNGLADMLLSAVSRGGGSSNNVLSALGIGGQSMSAQELGTLGQHVAQNHPNELASVLGEQFAGSGGGGGSVLGLLGSPMVRQIGMNLARRLM